MSMAVNVVVHGDHRHDDDDDVDAVGSCFSDCDSNHSWLWM